MSTRWTSLWRTAAAAALLLAASPAKAQRWVEWWDQPEAAGPWSYRGAIASDDASLGPLLFEKSTSARSYRVWRFQGDGWMPVTVTTAAPPVRYGESIVGTEDGDVLLFGGRLHSDAGGDDSDRLFAFDARTGAWSERALAGPRPPARRRHAAAWDGHRRRLVVFGGLAGTRQLSDVWEYDLDADRWEDLTPASRDVPPARHDHGMAYDAGRRRIVVFGGYSMGGGGYQDEVWEWSTRTGLWIRVPAIGERPAPRTRAGLTWYGPAWRVVLHGGERYDPLRGLAIDDGTWSWDGARWTRFGGTAGHEGEPRSEPALHTDPRTGRLLVYGGRGPNGARHDTRAARLVGPPLGPGEPGDALGIGQADVRGWLRGALNDRYLVDAEARDAIARFRDSVLTRLLTLGPDHIAPAARRSLRRALGLDPYDPPDDPATNRAPDLSAHPDVRVFGGYETRTQHVAGDPDNHAVALYARDLPPGATFDPGTGQLAWTPAPEAAGVYEVVIGATDGAASTEKTMLIRVDPIDWLPGPPHTWDGRVDVPAGYERWSPDGGSTTSSLELAVLLRVTGDAPNDVRVRLRGLRRAGPLPLDPLPDFLDVPAGQVVLRPDGTTDVIGADAPVRPDGTFAIEVDHAPDFSYRVHGRLEAGRRVTVTRVDIGTGSPSMPRIAVLHDRGPATGTTWPVAR